MNRRINELRADISKISQMNDPIPLPKIKRNTNLKKTKYQIVDEQALLLLLLLLLLFI